MATADKDMAKLQRFIICDVNNEFRYSELSTMCRGRHESSKTDKLHWIRVQYNLSREQSKRMSDASDHCLSSSYHHHLDGSAGARLGSFLKVSDVFLIDLLTTLQVQPKALRN